MDCPTAHARTVRGQPVAGDPGGATKSPDYPPLTW